MGVFAEKQLGDAQVVGMGVAESIRMESVGMESIGMQNLRTIKKPL